MKGPRAGSSSSMFGMTIIIEVDNNGGREKVIPIWTKLFTVIHSHHEHEENQDYDTGFYKRDG